MRITVDHVTKILKNKKVLDDVSAEFESRSIYGLTGENGSGKTMLLRALSGLIRTDSGQVLYDGVQIKDGRQDIGLMIENMGLYPELNSYENLKYLTGLNKKVSKETILANIEKVGLNPADKRSFRKYSLGMKQRLVFAQAIFEDPAVLLLDEPTNALDEKGVLLIQNLLKEMRGDERVIIVASHNREFIQELADEIYVMDSGRLRRETYEN